MGSTSKSLKKKSENIAGNEEEKYGNVLGKISKTDEVKSGTNVVIAEDWKGPSSPAGLSSVDGRKPAEVFRTDLISAMKLPDYHVLNTDTYITIADQWRQEWERGVQVPVNPEGLHQPSFREIEIVYKKLPNFKLASQLVTSESRTRPKKKCPYNLNRMDVEWLTRFNKSRRNRGNLEVEENTLEKAIAYLENKCYDNMGHAITTQDGLSIEFDEDVCCDVCQSPDAEEQNEMVFCDACDICVHQACYGIRNIPPGSYLCHPCRKRAVSPSCLLCPITGGAMKRPKNGKGWIHVSCALWIPEVGFGNVEKMEPITRVENIPASRWNLVCVLCREKVGACIQCSVKSCVTAFHVTCAFKNGLEMRTVLDDSSADGVRHFSYCAKHGHKNKSPGRSPEKEKQTKEEKETLRQKKLRQMEEEFHTFIDVAEAAKDLNLPKEAMSHIHAYWTLKRKAQYDVPLLPPTLQQQEKLSGKQVSADVRLQHQMEKFVRLRHDLERLRNLCYMVNKREKTRRELFRAQEQVFWKQVEILTDEKRNLNEGDVKWVIEAGTGNFTSSCNFNPEIGSRDSSSDNESDSDSGTERSYSGLQPRKEGEVGSTNRASDNTRESAAETVVTEPSSINHSGTFSVREARRRSKAEETKAVSVMENRINDSVPCPLTSSPGRRASSSGLSRRKSSQSTNAVASPLTPRLMTKHATSFEDAESSGESTVESDTVLVSRPLKKTRKHDPSSAGRLTRSKATKVEMVSLPYYAKNSRKKSTKSQQLKRENKATLNQEQDLKREPSVSVELPFPQRITDKRAAVKCRAETALEDIPFVETVRRRTRSSSEVIYQGSVDVIAEAMQKTPERVLRNRRREYSSSDKEQCPFSSATPLNSRKRKLESSFNSVRKTRFPESSRINNSNMPVTLSRVKREPQLPENKVLSDEEFPKENEPTSPHSRSPKRMRITADNEVVQEALERGFDAQRLRSNASFGTGDAFLNTQSEVKSTVKKQPRITNFYQSSSECKIKSQKDIHKMRCRHRNDQADRSCALETPPTVKNGNHSHSSSTCPDCKIHRDQYRTLSPQRKQNSPSHADRWNGFISRRDLGLRPLDSSPRSEGGYQGHQITVI